MKTKPCKKCEKKFREDLLTNGICYECEVAEAIKANSQLQVKTTTERFGYV